MQTDARATVVIPCFNEEATIGGCIDRISRMDCIGQIIVVDDGSFDRTAGVVTERIAAVKTPIQLVRAAMNSGKAAAIRLGVGHARGELIVIHDADMIVAGEALRDMCRAIEEHRYDIVIGSRFILPREKHAIPASHLFGNKILASSFSFLLGQKITDVLCGIKVLRRDDFLAMQFRRCRWGDLDILVGGRQLGLRVGEYPIPYFKRRGGKSKMRPFYDTFIFTRVTFEALFQLKIKPFFLGSPAAPAGVRGWDPKG